MELYRDIHEMVKPSLLKYGIYFKMPIDIPLWKTNTGQKRSFFFGPKISSKINRGGCNRIPTYSHLVRKRTFKTFLEIQATIVCRFTLHRQTLANLNGYPIVMIDINIDSLINSLVIFSYHHLRLFKSFFIS